MRQGAGSKLSSDMTLIYDEESDLWKTHKLLAGLALSRRPSFGTDILDVLGFTPEETAQVRHLCRTTTPPPSPGTLKHPKP
jgi:hypothetical protein